MDQPHRTALLAIAAGAFLGAAAGVLLIDTIWGAAIGAGIGAFIGQLAGTLLVGSPGDNV